MAKNRTMFVCRECGYESSGWLGKCPSCLQWNTFDETRIDPAPGTGALHAARSAFLKTVPVPVAVNDISTDAEERVSTGIGEMDRVLGGGMVRGSLILVGGDPGIGKSTLLLQICETLKSGDKILYISGEESVRQIKMRAERLGVKRRELLLVSTTGLEEISSLIESVKPGLVIIDSIQTMQSENITSVPGSVSQVREVTSALVRIAKSMDITIIIVGHVTKEGAIAGPRVLEHMVDTVLYFEGERHLSFRILRAVKNRFGSTNEIGIFEMRDSGLAGIDNPSALMIAGRPSDVPGSVIVSSLEGTRPMLIEVQALVCASNFGLPRRMATGLDQNRVNMLMAVLEKRTGMQLYNYDAYVNVIGGIKIEEPACDLGIAAAIASSFRNIPVNPGLVFIGEIGLAGEVRAVNSIEKRINEAARIGFKGCIIPRDNMKNLLLKEKKDFDILTVSTVTDMLELLG